MALWVVAIDSEVLFQSLISSFSLSITFRMISGSEVKLHVQCFSKGLEEVGYEFCTMIRSDCHDPFPMLSPIPLSIPRCHRMTSPTALRVHQLNRPQSN